MSRFVIIIIVLLYVISTGNAQVHMPWKPAAGSPVQRAWNSHGVSCGELIDRQSGQVLKNSCTGMVKVGGYNWYYGEAGQSCGTVCAAHGGYNEATRTYAGSDGTFQNCLNVAAVFGERNAGTDGQPISAAGCFVSTVDGKVHRRSVATTSTFQAGNTLRFCACNS